MARSRVAPLRGVDELEGERLRVQDRSGAHAGELPGRDVGEVLVVAPRFAVGRLVLLPEVAAAGLAAVERIDGNHLREFEEVRHPEGPLEVLVQVVLLSWD